MSRKLRLIKTSIYVQYDQFNELKDVNFAELQGCLKQFFSKRGDGKNCVSIVRVFPTLASSNTIDIELAAFHEEISFLDETDAPDDIIKIIDEYIDLEFSHFIIKQINDPLQISGDLE